MAKYILMAFVLFIAGCGATIIPLFDKPGGTRDQEFADRLACIKEQQNGFAPGAKVARCMKERGWQFVGYETP